MIEEVLERRVVYSRTDASSSKGLSLAQTIRKNYSASTSKPVSCATKKSLEAYTLGAAVIRRSAASCRVAPAYRGLSK